MHEHQFAILTNIISKAWSGKTVKEYKQHKGLKKENLRDNMTGTELILNMLAEASTKDISQATQPQTFAQNQQVAQRAVMSPKWRAKNWKNKLAKPWSARKTPAACAALAAPQAAMNNVSGRHWLDVA